jgi:UDP-GlcNAc:undecaprenyl-phosphate GlcNAc-1-phosphate transferase
LAAVALTLVGAYLLKVRFRKLGDEGVTATGLYERLLRLHHRYPVVLFVLDGILVGLAYLGAYLIRWDVPQLARELEYFQRSLPVVLAVKLLVFGGMRVYSESLTHYGLGEALRVLRASLMASVSMVAALLMLQRTGLSRGVVAIDFLLVSLLLVGARFSFRIMETWARRWSREGTAAVLVGKVEELGVALLEMEGGRWPHLRPVAVADESLQRREGRFKGYPVFGLPGGIQRAVSATGAEALILVEWEGEGGGGSAPDLGAGEGVVLFTLKVGMTLQKENR